MSLSECERFSADLQSSATLRAEVEKIRNDQSQPVLAAMVALAVSKGYSVTLDEAREHVRAKAAAAGKVLSDADLDGVAAGFSQASLGAELGLSQGGLDNKSSNLVGGGPFL
jgi:hypothetical protein